MKLCEHQEMMYNRYLHCRNYGVLHTEQQPLQQSSARASAPTASTKDPDGVGNRGMYKRGSMYSLTTSPGSELLAQMNLNANASVKSPSSPQSQGPALGPALDDYNITVGNAASAGPVGHRRQSMRSRDIVKFDLDNLPDDLLGSNTKQTEAQTQALREEDLRDRDDASTLTAANSRTVTHKPSISHPRTNKAAVLRRASSYGEFVPAPAVEPFASTSS